MHITAKILVTALLLTFCTAASAQETFNEAYKAYNVDRRARNYDAAMNNANKALELAANGDQKATAYTLIANTYNGLKKPDEAIKAMESALAIEGLKPDKMASLYWSKGGIYASNKQYEDARKTYQLITEIKESSPRFRSRSLIAIANTYTYSDPSDYAKAREALAAVKDVQDASDDDKAEAIYAESLLDRLEKNYTAANAKITSILDTQGISDNVRAKYLMAMADNYRMAEQYDKAVSTYQALVEDEKNSPYVHSRALLMIGSAHTSANDIEKARKAYQTLIDMKDAYPSYVTNAKRYLERLKDK